MPVTSPRRSHADMRRDGSTTAQTVLNPPSMNAEDCTAHQDSQPERIGSAASRAARLIAQQRKFGCFGEQETKMAGKEKSDPVSVRVLHFSQLLTGFAAFHAHGSNSPRRLIGYPSTIRVSTSHK